MSTVQVYELESCYNKTGNSLFQHVYLHSSVDISILQHLESEKFPSSFGKIRVFLGSGKREKKRPVGDFCFFINQHLVFSRRAKEIFAEYLGESGDFLPLDEEEGRELWLFHVRKPLTVLDPRKSLIERAPAGFITEIKALSFDVDSVKHLFLFRAAEIHPGGPCFLTHNFIHLMREHKLEGICPKLIWEG